MTPPHKQGLWQPSNEYLAQVTHLLAGAAVILAAAHQNWRIGWAIIIFWVIAAAKEFLIDTSPFEGDSYAGSTADFTFYVLGSLAAWVALDWFWIGVGLVGLCIVGLMSWDILRENCDSQTFP